MKGTYYRSLDGSDFEKRHPVNFERFPDECPICHKGQEPKFVTSVFNTRMNVLEAVFKCSIYNCAKLFMTYYTLPQQGRCLYLRSQDSIKPDVFFDSDIVTTSPQFPYIYNQAKRAEDLGLDQIAGMGYRKALEFLIKDYLINVKDLESDMIRKLALGACINNYTTANIKAVASRATWIGNDETHYERVYKNNDIEDLKLLLKLTVNWIDDDIKTIRYIETLSKQ